MGLQEHRSEIERIDEEIIRLINQRIGISKKIFESKKAEGKPISDPEREKKVLSKAMDLATELNLDTGAVKSIFETLIAMSISKQQELQGKNQG
ncbi:MAG: chorismate mutase [Methanosaeta sp. PtaU1.Bin112]|nr:MAG: chorismate mutase [Methanosaeta sp. PtaU1.Bin112]